tara:strand:+ start:21191 stop:21373 length:183 start_codon:yes stop_codon:yes gene_type:complete
LIAYTDTHYMIWTMPIAVHRIERFGFPKTLDVDESLATFLCSRGHALADVGQPRDAVRST